MSELWKELNFVEMGRRIKTQREYLGITKEKLAEHLDVSAKFIHDIEYGYRGLSIKRLYRLCQVLGVPADYILAGEKYDEGSEISRIRESVILLLKGCDIDELKGIENIARIYADGMRRGKIK